VKRELKDYSTTEDEDEEEEGKLKRETKEESVRVKQEPISRRSGQVQVSGHVCIILLQIAIIITYYYYILMRVCQP